MNFLRRDCEVAVAAWSHLGSGSRPSGRIGCATRRACRTARVRIVHAAFHRGKCPQAAWPYRPSSSHNSRKSKLPPLRQNTHANLVDASKSQRRRDVLLGAQGRNLVSLPSVGPLNTLLPLRLASRSLDVFLSETLDVAAEHAATHRVSVAAGRRPTRGGLIPRKPRSLL